MQMLLRGLAAAALTLSTPSVSAAPRPAPELSAEEQVRIAEAVDRGALLYAYDQAAWHGTDAMREKVPDYQSRVGGWVVDGPAEAPQAVFFDKAARHAVFTASFRDGKLDSIRVAGPDEPELSAERKQAIAARAAGMQAIVAAGVQRCVDAAMNSVVLPPHAPGGPTLVYVLTPQTDLDVIPFGGHYRATVGADGKVGEVRAFTKSCLAMPLSQPGKPRPVAIMVTHLLDPVPTEIHVFSSLVARMPVAVGTPGGRVWLVEGQRITLLQPGKP